MFAGRPFAARDVLLPTGDSVIGIIDIMLHQPQHTEAFLWDEYTWSGRALRLDREGYHEVNVASAGFGAAVNCFLPVVNADELNPVLQWEGLRRDRDPGAGASTQYHNRLSVAQRPIAAGEEFFVTCEFWLFCCALCCPSCSTLNHCSRTMRILIVGTILLYMYIYLQTVKIGLPVVHRWDPSRSTTTWTALRLCCRDLTSSR